MGILNKVGMKCIKMMSPLLDLWRAVYKELLRRGGLHLYDDEYMLRVTWQKTHTRASRAETTLQKLRRRGNHVADLLANDGRLLHVDDVRCNNGHQLDKYTAPTERRMCDVCQRDNIGPPDVLYRCIPCGYDMCADCAPTVSQKHMQARKWRIQTIMKRGTEWATWVGRAALAQRSKDYFPDHTLPPPRRGKVKNLKLKRPTIPQEAKVIRKFPCAARSLGTVEFTEDLHDELDETHAAPTTQAIETLQKWRTAPVTDDPAEARVRRYMSVFRCHGGNAATGKRLLPNYLGHEDLDELLPSSALGHRMQVAGLPPRQYFWCQTCGAHSGRRARNLTRHCMRKMRNPKAIFYLDAGRHPYEENHPMLATQPRRLTTRDVGGVGHGWQADSDGSITGDERMLPAILRSSATGQQHCADEEVENPFGFDLSLDSA